MARNSPRIVLLGGSAEADHLALLMGQAGWQGWRFVRPGGMRRPPLPGAGAGGDAGHDAAVPAGEGGLAALLARADAVVLGMHPFAADEARRAAAIAARLGVPALRLLRPSWTPGPADRWHAAADTVALALLLRRSGARRPFVALGRDRMAPLAAPGLPPLTLRVLGSGGRAHMAHGRVVTGPGPFTIASEAALFRRLGVDMLITRNTGGAGGWPKVGAARRLGLPVLLLSPPAPPLMPRRREAAGALAWLGGKLGLEIPSGLA